MFFEKSQPIKVIYAVILSDSQTISRHTFFVKKRFSYIVIIFNKKAHLKSSLQY
ncbi:hypothetical protein HMPREF7215_1929 [Pyramidobacter piscolens W5455]|uniref:Uncharacterized protein n=1 Tax=Pyramidobacter piscolens W5455 TaxID=352165 RepID=A0ABM9ZUB8_9BACT|nr:hypothetical protein HMPREF7215_1929 [Pyramidobacter piscolens W5455]